MKKFCRCLLSFPFLASCLCGCSPKSDDLDKTIYHTVTFDTDGGSKIAPIKVKHGDRIPIPKEVPTKARREFDEYRIYSGKLTVDNSFEYKNGEAEGWWGDYFGEDDGPYLALSDITFKVKWKYGIYTIDYANRISWPFTGDFSEDFYSLSESITAQLDIGFGRGSYFSDLDDFLSSNNTSEIIFISKAYLLNPEDSSKSDFEYSDFDITARANSFASIPSSDQTWIKNNFTESIYQNVTSEETVFGYPIYCVDELWYNKDTEIYDISAKKVMFGVLNKNVFTEDNPIKDDMYETCTQYLKLLSKAVNSIE